MLIRLERDDWWPDELKTAVLKEIATKPDLCIEDAISSEFGPIYDVALELEYFVRRNQLLVYHCTKEPHSGFFKENGLRCLNIQQHRKEFMVNHGHIFTDDEREWILSRWNMEFYRNQESARNDTIWFCFTPQPVLGSGAKLLLALFGGEAIYFPLLESPDIAFKLSTIGKPVIVEVAVTPDSLRTSYSMPFAMTTMTIFGNRHNSQIYKCICEGRVNRNIFPEQITRVVPKEVFFRENVKLIEDL